MKYESSMVILAAAVLACTWCARPAGAAEQIELERDPDLLAGRAALQDGFYDVAARRFEQYVAETISRRQKAYASIFMFRAWFGEEAYDRILDWIDDNPEVNRGTRYEAASVYWYARALYAKGRYEEALANLKDFGKRYPDDEFLPYGVRLRSQALREDGQWESAASLMAWYDSQFPGREEVPENLLDWGDVLLRLKRPVKAQETLRRLVEEYPEHEASRQARLWLGQQALETMALQEAQGWLEPLATSTNAGNGIRANAWFALARVAMADGQPTNALEALRVGETLTGEAERKIEARIDQARLLMNMDRLNEAMELLNQTVLTASTQSEASRAQLELADLLRARERFEKAAEAYQHYIESFTDAAGLRHAQYSRAWCLWSLERYAEAALAFEKAYAMLRNNMLREQALTKAGDAYFINGQYRLAAVAYERVLEEFPESETRGELVYQSGESYARSGDSANAVRMFRAAAEEKASADAAPQGLLRLAGFYEEQREWDQAFRVYHEVALRFQDSRHYRASLLAQAMLKYRLNRISDAQSDFEQVLAKFPESPEAAQAKFMRVRCLYQLGSVSQALSLAADFLAENPEASNVPEAYFWLAAHAFNQQEFRAAETNFALVASRYPSHRLADQALYWAGRSAMGYKEPRRAMDEYFNVLVRQYPQSLYLPETRFSQGDALVEIGDFSGAILAFNEIILHYPYHELAPQAAGRIGDCQFTLGSERPERFAEAAETFRSLLANPRMTPFLSVQVEYKLGRACERLGRIGEASSHYLNVVYDWLSAREKGEPVDEVWFVRAAFAAAALKEAEEAWDEAVRIYERVVTSGVPAGADATIRIDRINNQRQKASQPGSAARALP